MTERPSIQSDGGGGWPAVGRVPLVAGTASAVAAAGPTIRHFIVATAGHVDHGKSALVCALTGTDPDRLPEEKERGITIDLGFAPLALSAPDGCLHLGIVDVPGHLDFVRNMVAGVGATDLALLCVGADDGWMPQTEEHLQILAYLGATRAVVALTKADRIDPAAEPAAIAAVRERLRGSPFAEAAIVPTSVVSGRGLAEIRAAIAATLASVPSPPDGGKPRLWIDRAFLLRGIGAVVTGTLTGGRLAVGDPVLVLPGETATRIRSIHCHGRAQPRAHPGMRTALNLADVTVRAARDPAKGNAIRRGELLTPPGSCGITGTCDVWLERSARPPASPIAGRPLMHGTIARLFVGTATAPCRVVLASRGELGPGEQSAAQLRLESPLPLVHGERFVIRDAADRATLAGGIVLDPAASRKRFRRRAQQQHLAALQRAGADAIPTVAAWLAHDGFLHRPSLGRHSNLPAPTIAAAIDEGVRRGELIDCDGQVGLNARWGELLRSADTAIREHHRAHPAQLGLPLAQLRAAIGSEPWLANVFGSLVAALTRSGFEIVGGSIRHCGHRPQLPESLLAAAVELRGRLGRHPLDPPGRKALAPDAASDEALRFLLKTGEVVELGPDVVLLTAAFDHAREAVRRHLETHVGATVSELRQVVGASRRIVVPLMERLDRDGVTMREGDSRVLRVAAPADAR